MPLWLSLSINLPKNFLVLSFKTDLFRQSVEIFNDSKKVSLVLNDIPIGTNNESQSPAFDQLRKIKELWVNRFFLL